MTVTTAYSVLTSNCNGSVTAFSVTWPFFFSSDLVVTHISDTGVETVLTLTTDYTVSGGRDGTTGLPGTGTVTTVVTYAAGHKIRITRATPKTQQTAITSSGAFPAKTVEAMIDRVHMIAEEGGFGGGTPDIDGAVLRLETSGATDYWDGESYIARGFADGVNDDDLATVGQIAPYATAAVASAAAAAASETAAAASETSAASSETAAAASASAASTSASNAATSETNAATSATAAAASAGFSFTYSTTTTMADPGSGTVRFNNATLASVTAIAIDDLAADTGNPDVSAWILTFDNSTATSKGLLRFRKKSAPQNFVDFVVTGLTDNSGWTELAVTHSTSNGSLFNSDELLMAFYATGDVGPTGPGTGDVSGPATSVASEIALFDGTTGKLLKSATTTGIVKATAGVISAAVSGTDYAPATSGSAILKGDGAGGFSSATAGTDYANASHTHAAGDITLPARLGEMAATTVDWNLAVENGWYMGYDAPNSPTVGQWYIGTVEAHNTLYITQTVHAFTLDGGSDTIMFRRDCNGGSWGAWYKLQLSQAEQDARYALKSEASNSVKAWVNVDTTGTVTILGSNNVASVTDNGVGDWTVNFTAALPNANYAVIGTATLWETTAPGQISGTVVPKQTGSDTFTTKTTTACRVVATVSSTYVSPTDFDNVYIAFMD